MKGAGCGDLPLESAFRHPRGFSRPTRRSQPERLRHKAFIEQCNRFRRRALYYIQLSSNLQLGFKDLIALLGFLYHWLCKHQDLSYAHSHGSACDIPLREPSPLRLSPLIGQHHGGKSMLSLRLLEQSMLRSQPDPFLPRSRSNKNQMYRHQKSRKLLERTFHPTKCDSPAKSA